MNVEVEIVVGPVRTVLAAQVLGLEVHVVNVPGQVVLLRKLFVALRARIGLARFLVGAVAAHQVASQVFYGFRTNTAHLRLERKKNW